MMTEQQQQEDGEVANSREVWNDNNVLRLYISVERGKVEVKVD